MLKDVGAGKTLRARESIKKPESTAEEVEIFADSDALFLLC